uniref:Uncharacterized protein n=1 Tax=Opuntia streptacantha TaxID=393608 RepID=A0A7C9A6N8_OPUST
MKLGHTKFYRLAVAIVRVERKWLQCWNRRKFTNSRSGWTTKKFNIVRSNILSQEPLPSLNKAYAAVIREERPLQFTQLTEPIKAMEGAAFKVASQNRSSSNRPKCSHCQKLGHEQHQCYELVRYPPWWDD